MPAEKKDRHTVADNASADCPKIFFPQRCSPDRSASPDQLSALSPAQNPVRRLRAYNPVRTSEFAIRPACGSSSLIQKRVSHSRAAPGVPAAAAPLSTSDECKAAAPTESEPGLRSPAEYCLT